MPRIITEPTKDNIPSLDILALALNNKVLPLVKALHSEGYISGAVFYGSVPRNEHSYSSDIDVLVRYYKISALPILKKARIKIAEEDNVIVEFSTFSDELAETPFHRHGYSYLAHICANLEEKVTVGKHPSEDFFHPRLSAKSKDDRVMYAQDAGAEIDLITKRYLVSSDSQKSYESFLKGLLEKPKHFVRECVCIINDGLPVGKYGKIMDKNADLLSEFYKEFPKESPIGEMTAYIYNEINSYNHYLQGIKDGRIIPSRKDNLTQLRRIEDTFEFQMNWMIDLAKYLNTKFQLNSALWN